MSFNYGLDGTKHKDWVMFIFETDILGDNWLDDFINEPKTETLIAEVFDNTDPFHNNYLGELRQDSISLVGDDGEEISGNLVGNIIINKNCSLTAELINATVENSNQLSKLDGSVVSVFLFEKFDVMKYQNSIDKLNEELDSKTLIVIPEAILKYSENITGGNITRSTVTFSKTTGKIRNFRHVIELYQGA